MTNMIPKESSKARKNDERVSQLTEIPDEVISSTLFP